MGNLKENIKNEQKNQKVSIWKKYFAGWNFVINALIVLIPVSLVIGILRDILRDLMIGGALSALIIVGVLYGFIYLAGIVREKIGKKYNPKDKKSISVIISLIAWAIFLLLMIAGISITAFLSNQQNSTDENLTLMKADKEEIIGNLYRNNQYKFRIKFPNGWEIEDGDGPHIIKKATKEGSTVLVYVRNFFEGEEGKLLLDEMKREYKKETGINISDSEAKQVMAELTADDFSYEKFEEMMSGVLDGMLSKYKEIKVIEKGIRYIDNKKAFYTRVEAHAKILDIDVQIINVQYSTLYNGNIYGIGGAALKDDFPIIEKQINLSIGSFVFENF